MNWVYIAGLFLYVVPFTIVAQLPARSLYDARVATEWKINNWGMFLKASLASIIPFSNLYFAYKVLREEGVFDKIPKPKAWRGCDAPILDCLYRMRSYLLVCLYCEYF